MKEKIIISFSGGETSAYMGQYLLKKYGKDIIFVFANTGQEHDETYLFIERFQNHFDVQINCIEAKVIFENRKGTQHDLIPLDKCNRNGKPFEDIIKKYGIPNKAFPHCTRELKTQPINHFIRSLGIKNYKMAIGIRNDEIDRINPDYKKKKLYYPLAFEYPTTKPMVNEFWNNMPFRLNLKGYQGNCVWCWKKSLRKLLTIAKHNPEYFNFPERMEMLYGKGEYVFFRNHKSAKNILELSKQKFTEARDDTKDYPEPTLFDNILDLSNGCVESCEPF